MKHSAMFRARFFMMVATIWVLTSALGYARSAGPAATTQEQESSGSKVHGSLPCTLSKSLDSKKAKEGDPVWCETAGTVHTPDGMLIASGTRIIGHITQAQAKSKGDAQSSLAFVFDKIQLGKNEEIPIKGTLQAMAPGFGNSGPDPGAATPGTSIMGKGGAGGGTAAPPTSQPGVQSGPNAGQVHQLVNSQSKGALGFKNLTMDDNSVITSTGKEVKLDNGTQLMIHAQ